MSGKTALLTLLLSLVLFAALQACSSPGKPRCGVFDRGYPLCGI